MFRRAERESVAVRPTVQVRRTGTRISAMRTAGRCRRRADAIKPRQVTFFRMLVNMNRRGNFCVVFTVFESVNVRVPL